MICRNRLFRHLVLLALLPLPHTGQSQDVYTIPIDSFRQLDIRAELRPRTELRYGYRQLPTDSNTLGFHISQRARLELNYRAEKIHLRFSVQDIRVWGEDDPRATDGTVQLFESYFEVPLVNNLSARIGRQRVVYDNQRLFAENNWRQNANAHDAARLIYQIRKTKSELLVAFNQTKDHLFSTDLNPKLTSNYKFLAVHYLSQHIAEKLKLQTLQVIDGYQASTSTEAMHMRFTNGGRLEFQDGFIYTTIAAYYQHGTAPNGQTVSAYYFQPEIRIDHNRKMLRVGLEWLSGDRQPGTSTSHSFVPLYGVAHRFMGSLDYFTAFPTDVGRAGLINPYLFTSIPISKTLALRNDFHGFFAEQKLDRDSYQNDLYLGFEHDLLLTLKVRSNLIFDWGASYLLPTRLLAKTKDEGNSDRTPFWSYMMITYTPELISLKLK